ncbi:MAG: NTP transferase domain-containing protein [Armatimonadetes bacterium]|nr:NTP transferase domain-containing protein [Armatimonadota bacterium]
MSRNAALVTAKGNNQSLPDKNLTTICGKPSLQHVIEAARDAALIDEIYVSTEDHRIRELSEVLGCRIIDRPAELAQPDSNHGDVIRHGVEQIKADLPDLDCVVVLLGNTVMVNAPLLDLALKILAKRRDLTSVMSVWQAQDDHPYRALKVNDEGCLESFLNIQAGTSRQYYPTVYYYDQGVWALRHEAVWERTGPSPWWWMGARSFPILRNWVTGRDFHTQLDLDVADYWITTGHEDEILNWHQIQAILGDES